MYREILQGYGVEFSGAVPFSVCRVFDEDIITRRGIAISEIKSAILFLVPYYFDDGEKGNISVYARAHDYHLFFEKLYSDIVPKLETAYNARFWGFADKSAIGEVGAASCAGLGAIGDNGLIINEKYGSFVFIGEILSDVDPERLGCSADVEYEPSFCTHCGACRAACPMNEGQGCLSFVTQKKGELAAEEEALILKYGYAWGCDICAAVCPFTKKAIAAGNTTPIEFFKNDRIAFLTFDAVEAMDKQTFKKRAFSWRGKKTIIRNLELFEK
jgi:epoxyqueuosine reductase